MLPFKFQAWTENEKAALSGRMYRERQFITGFPANRIRQEYEACDDIIMVQGIIDCCLRRRTDM